MKVTVIPIVIGAHGTISKDLVKRVERLEIRGQVEIIQSTVLLRSKSPGHLRRLAVTQTPVKGHHADRKNSHRVNYSINSNYILLETFCLHRNINMLNMNLNF